MPAIYPWRWFPEAGGLMSYAASLPDLSRRAATYVDRILKGAKPGDLPVEQPTTFEFVINLRTAQALGLTIPPSLLFQANEVIRGAARPNAPRRDTFCRIKRPNPWRRLADTPHR
jgi:putative ABC transport system substrate-binding protein